jgi:hypothetical protein
VACHAGIQPVVEALTLGYEMHLVAPFISVGFSKVQPKMCQPRRIVDIFLRKGKISQPGCQWCNPRVPVVQSPTAELEFVAEFGEQQINSNSLGT